MMRVFHSMFAAVVKSFAFLQDRKAAKRKSRRVLSPAQTRVDRLVGRTLCVVFFVSLLATANSSARHAIAHLAHKSQIRVSSWTSSLPTKLYRSLTGGDGRYELTVHVPVEQSKTVSSPHSAGYSTAAGSIPVVPNMIPWPPDAPLVFTDDPLEVGVTVMRALHITELRDAINLVRVRAGLAAASWDEAVAPGVPIRAAQILELRARLDDARIALGMSGGSYSGPPPSIGGSIRAAHVRELRERVKELFTTTANASAVVARLDPANRTGGGGEDPLSRNFNWSVPLVRLPGRSGLDLGLSLSYNSLVWTKSGSFISFDDDRGFPSPGFRLGFPVIHSIYFNSEVGKNAFLLITPNGERVELRQVGSSNLYEAADSSHLLLDSSSMILRTTDGAQLSYAAFGSEFQCTQIKDPNGNFITVTYTGDGRINTIVDTLGRTLTFNYHPTDITLTSIAQSWVGQPGPHVWASFTYTNTEVQTGFGINVTKLGPANGSTVKTLRSVTLNDNSRFEFDHTTWIQVSKINRYAADGHLLNYRSYNLPAHGSTQLDDCPRFSERRDWAENFNRGGSPGASGLPSGSEEEVLTGPWTVPTNASWTLPDGTTNESGVVVQVTLPDGTYNKVYFAGTAGTGTGWKRGLPSMVETYGKTTPDQPPPIKQRSRVSTWTQDDEDAPFLLNPRVKETHVYDFDGAGQIKNHARTRITYVLVDFGDGTSCRLPQDVFEYQANATTVLRRTRTDYHTPVGAYISARVVGLPSEGRMYEVNPDTEVETLMTQVAFAYDESGSVVGTDAPIQHDNTHYGAGFVVGRGNLSSVTRYNVVNGQSTVTRVKYDTAGSPRATIDPLEHEVNVGYADAFSDGINRNTLAYATSVTDDDGFTATTQYNFNHGSITRSQTPPPAGNSVGPIKKFTYDSKTRLEKVEMEINNNPDYSHARFVYPDSQNRIDTYTTIEAGEGEALAFTLLDGHGRTFATASVHPGSTGGYSGKLTLFDKLGRTIKDSNPTETNVTSGTYLQWQALGDDNPTTGGPGWVYTSQTYDWNGRPLTITNPAGKSKTASYDGCGCAGGDVVTLTDEVETPAQALLRCAGATIEDRSA